MLKGLLRIQQTFFDLHLIVRVMPNLLRVGLPNTFILALLATLIGIALGLIIAIGLISSRRPIGILCRFYVDILRGLPHILTIYLIGQGLPLAGLSLFGDNTYAYAALAIGLIEGAYMAEIFRAGLQSVERGQIEAARTLGMTRAQTMLFIIVPQGIRRVLPPLTGQFILVIKGTALVFLLGLTASQRDLFSIAQDSAINNANLSPLTAAGFIYLALTVPMTYAVNAWERRLRLGPTPQRRTAL
ncbi:MAG TPA: amino acid ABC transporter permease [Acidiphilium sp.]|nr:MAG: amino acid ABC transporter permease [Acidiphilium sp. 21-60-14]OYV92204.1 MAG: amino acid ABC transporter permease [Acidiphilium sp. 37-60-79]OZB40612.1 MAG: amino acid ABC transporter permease [Acidiphilium sp. 34-60-192]HQT87431.1 amino acid ABC transporter permease [Acidiphilium sp.]HQU23137.1 amino acid ABC transporter permease [Acidiphilium sp.]